jgi:hypothetical protein
MSNFLATYISAGYSVSPVLADYGTLHLINTVVQFLWWILFTMCLVKSPGYVEDDSRVKQERANALSGSSNSSAKNGSSGKGAPKYHPHSYDAALELMGSDLAVEEATAERLPAVCHTCRVQKPLRSKHCKVKRKCVCKFDHFW